MSKPACSEVALQLRCARAQFRGGLRGLEGHRRGHAARRADLHAHVDTAEADRVELDIEARRAAFEFLGDLGGEVGDRLR
jgi:hypothetical protein